MCLTCKSCKKNNRHTLDIVKFLVFLGAFNWGLVGLGMFGNYYMDLNLVKYIFSSWPVFEAVVYLIIGTASLVYVFGYSCKSCKKKTCCSDCK